MPSPSLRVSIKEQDPTVRIKNFKEVCLGYSEEEALQEAMRCIECGSCIKGCPVQIDIPQFIHLIKEKKYIESVNKIKETNSFPGICGRVCPQEVQCELSCPIGKKGDPINIGKLERFVADWEKKNQQTQIIKIKKNSIKIAVIGSGPVGLTCAGELAKMGYDVTVFESLHLPGGVLRYGIPEFRLPRDVLENEIAYVKELGVKIEMNVLIGKTLTIDDLKEQGYQSIFIGVGAGLPSFLNVPGENLNGVLSSNEFLTRANLMYAYQNTEDYQTPINVKSPFIVVGGGNVAMDCARVAKRLGADVTVIYRRTEKEMPARIEEVEHAKQEGIKFHLLATPIEIMGQQGWIQKIKCIEMELTEPDESGRCRPVPKKGSEFEIDAHTLIIAIGQNPNPLIVRTLPALISTQKGTIQVDDNLMTSIPGIFAGGDIVTGAATVIEAMSMGRKAASSIDQWIKKG